MGIRRAARLGREGPKGILHRALRLGDRPGSLRDLLRSQGSESQPPGSSGLEQGWRDDEDSTFVSRLQALQRRLGPFVDVSGQTVFHYTWSVQQDSLISKDGYSRYARYRIRVSDQNMANEVFDVTTLCEPVVRMVRKYRVGRRDRPSASSRSEPFRSRCATRPRSLSCSPTSPSPPRRSPPR